jgi:hypothetical protein
MTDLEKLIEAVEAGEFADNPFTSVVRFLQLCEGVIPDDQRALGVAAFDAYGGDLNEARRLHEAMLPGWAWDVGRNMPPNGWHIAGVGSFDARLTARSDIPARAWLLAILRALQSQVQG